MITKIMGEAPFQVLTNNFSISPSNEGYTLQISADGKNYSNLFQVGANVTRLVTGVAANSYYRLLGNDSEVSINWMKTCVTEGGSGGSGTELQPITEFPMDPADGTVVAYNGSASASGVYQFDGTDWVPVGVDDLSAYYTSAQTEDAITSKNYITSAYTGFTPIDDFNFISGRVQTNEEVVSEALNDLNNRIEEISGNTGGGDSTILSPREEFPEDVDTGSVVAKVKPNILLEWYDPTGTGEDDNNFYKSSALDLNALDKNSVYNLGSFEIEKDGETVLAIMSLVYVVIPEYSIDMWQLHIHGEEVDPTDHDADNFVVLGIENDRYVDGWLTYPEDTGLTIYIIWDGWDRTFDIGLYDEDLDEWQTIQTGFEPELEGIDGGLLADGVYQFDGEDWKQIGESESGSPSDVLAPSEAFSEDDPVGTLRSIKAEETTPFPKIDGARWTIGDEETTQATNYAEEVAFGISDWGMFDGYTKENPYLLGTLTILAGDGHREYIGFKLYGDEDNYNHPTVEIVPHQGNVVFTENEFDTLVIDLEDQQSGLDQSFSYDGVALKYNDETERYEMVSASSTFDLSINGYNSPIIYVANYPDEDESYMGALKLTVPYNIPASETQESGIFVKGANGNEKLGPDYLKPAIEFGENDPVGSVRSLYAEGVDIAPKINGLEWVEHFDDDITITQPIKVVKETGWDESRVELILHDWGMYGDGTFDKSQFEEGEEWHAGSIIFPYLEYMLDQNGEFYYFNDKGKFNFSINKEEELHLYIGVSDNYFYSSFMNGEGAEDQVFNFQPEIGINLEDSEGESLYWQFYSTFTHDKDMSDYTPLEGWVEVECDVDNILRVYWSPREGEFEPFTITIPYNNTPSVYMKTDEGSEKLLTEEDVATKVDSKTVTNIWSGTQAEYDEIDNPDASTLYIIIE